MNDQPQKYCAKLISPSSNKKAIYIASEYLNKSKDEVAKILSAPNATISNNLHLNEAAKIKSKFLSGLSMILRKDF